MQAGQCRRVNRLHRKAIRRDLPYGLGSCRNDRLQMMPFRRSRPPISSAVAGSRIA